MITKNDIIEQINNTYENDSLVLDLCWRYLCDMCGVENQTLQYITNINGYNYETMCDVLYQATGYRDFRQLITDDDYM